MARYRLTGTPINGSGSYEVNAPLELVLADVQFWLQGTHIVFPAGCGVDQANEIIAGACPPGEGIVVEEVK